MLDVSEIQTIDHDVMVVGAHQGAAVTADELAGWCETIAYEVLTSVGKRVPRVYVEEFDA